MKYLTKKGENLAEIVYKRYSRVDGYLEKILEINRHIIFLGEIFEAGVEIELPDFKIEKETKKQLSLWN